LTKFIRIGAAVCAILLVLPLVAIGEAAAQQYFNGDICTDDCSGHQAGYDWAEQNGIDDPDDCGGNSQSFIEGCESYAEENGSSADEDSYYEDIDEDAQEADF